jgi:signal transduction histidine kinase
MDRLNAPDAREGDLLLRCSGRRTCSRTASPISISATSWQDSVEVRASDRADGIPKEERDRVFEPFVRGDHETAKGGSGPSIGRAHR